VQKRSRTVFVDVATGVVTAWLLTTTSRFSDPAGSPDTMRSGGWWRTRGEHTVPVWGPVSWWVVAAAVAVGIGLALRRSRPRIAYGIVVAATTGYLAAGGVLPIALVAPALCLWTLASTFPARIWIRWALLVVPMLWAGHLRQSWWGLTDPSAWFALIAGVMIILVAPLIALARREHQASTERVRAEELRRAAYEERLRLARDIHDVVGHSLSMISLQSGVALHLLDRDPGQARASLEAIRSGSRDALAELRRTLGVFRASASSDLLAPAPGLEALPGLVDGATAAGRTVRLHVPSTPDWAAPVSEVVQQAAHRIAQESVTNFVRHTRTGTLDLSVDVDADTLLLSAVNDGPVPVADQTRHDGQGLHSITERVAALGGEATIGPGPDGGWSVRVRLPLDGGPSQDNTEEHT